MSRSVGEITALATQRIQASNPRRATMITVRDTYDGTVVLPLPELDRHEVAAIANQLQTGLDGTAQRAATTSGIIEVPSARPGYKTHDNLARNQRRALYGWWERNAIPLLDGIRYRHFFGYASTPVQVRPSVKWGFAQWQVRDPLDTYPAPMPNAADMLPDNVIFCVHQSGWWLRRNYPDAGGLLPRPSSPGAGDGLRDDQMIKIIEYVDEFDIVLVAMGESMGHPVAMDYPLPFDFQTSANTGGFRFGIELERQPNRAERCLAVVPGRLTLGGPVGQFDALPGMHYKQAKLDALEYRAIEEGVFPKLWLVSHPNQGKAKVVTVADGRRGILGEIENGTIVNVNPQPSYMANQAQDRLERAQRLSGHVPAQMQGEGPSNVRTGRASDLVLSATIDHGIAEAQRVMAQSKQHELELAIDVARGWAPNRPVSFHVNWKGARGQADYKAAELFPAGSPPPTVDYSLAGSDMASLVIQLGQRLGTGLISKKTARKLDPMIDDAEFEDDQTTAEGLEAALLSGIQQQAAGGQLPPSDLARIIELVRMDKKDLAAAVAQVQAEAQKRQAPNVEPVDPGDPAAQPGIAVPGTGAEAGAQIPEPGPSQDRLAQLLNQLRTTRTSVGAAEQSVAG